jgi:hypothetical protein
MRFALTAAAALIATVGFTGAAFAQSNQVAPRTEAAGTAAAEKMSSADARQAVKEYMAANDMTNMRIGKIKQTDAGFAVELRSIEGVTRGTLLVDASGKVAPAK